jgi:N-methylhydantoinase B/oxoprolinase/acetone carboxylase alpha subunit
MSHLLRELLDRHVDPAAWAADDVVVTNDPYCGGQHLPDIVAFKPVFHEGRRIAFVGTLCHHIDVGGLAAGSYAAKAIEIYQEGLRIPPVKLIEGGRRNDGVWAMILQNVRKPDLLAGDLQSQIASLEVGAAALRRLADRYGAAGMVEAGARILDMSEAAMRSAIARMPDGTYEFEDFLDDDGVDLGKPIRLHVALTVAGDGIAVDLSGCSPQARGPVNATLASSNAAVMFAVMCACDEPFAANAGCYRPIRTVAPEGTVVNARHPAPVAHRIAATHRLLNAMFGALHQVVPDRIPAAYYGNSYVCTFQTVAEDARRDVLVEIEIGGSGGHPAKDGVNAFASGMHNNSNIPVEMIESQTPLTVTRYGLLPDSAGAGRHRGGLGLGARVARGQPGVLLHRQHGPLRPRPLRLGGRPARVGRPAGPHPDGEESDLPPKADNVPLVKGDRVRLETSGGGGFGDPATRAAASVERDLALGYVSRGR